MGCEWKLTLFSTTPEQANRVGQLCFSRIRVLDECLSDYQQNSELSKALRLAYPGPVSISKDLERVLTASLKMSRRTHGLFDPTLGPLTSLWRKSRKEGQLPTESEFHKAKSLVGTDKVKLRRQSLSLSDQGVKIDFGGIAKGFACDQVISICRRERISSALIEGGGDLKSLGSPPGTKGWEVSIQGNSDSIVLHDQAMSTSGSTEQYVLINGVRYSHILDPRTGIGVPHLRQVTVIGKNGVDTDPLATAAVIDPVAIRKLKGFRFIVIDRSTQ